VDHPDTLGEILAALHEIGEELPVIFPVHPRTRAAIQQLGSRMLTGSDVRLCEPLGYVDFLTLTSRAKLVLTDSGGVQEETTFLGIPCLTARSNTERPVTISQGTNRLVASTRPAILQGVQASLNKSAPGYQPPELWDGHAAQRIVQCMTSMV
jgi:UDP-N-acetylglucosamine 2-epimerase (non-hydrolysing)